MSGGQVRAKVISSSAILQAVGDALSAIRQEDRLTWADMDAVLGKSDRAPHYADGSAAMDVVAYYRAKAAWNGRFTGGADRLIDDAREPADDRACECNILKAALALSSALEDGQVDAAEVRKNRATLEAARDAIEAQLAKLSPRSLRARTTAALRGEA